MTFSNLVIENLVRITLDRYISYHVFSRQLKESVQNHSIMQHQVHVAPSWKVNIILFTNLDLEKNMNYKKNLNSKSRMSTNNQIDFCNSKEYLIWGLAKFCQLGFRQSYIMLNMGDYGQYFLMRKDPRLSSRLRIYDDDDDVKIIYKSEQVFENKKDNDCFYKYLNSRYLSIF